MDEPEVEGTELTDECATLLNNNKTKHGRNVVFTNQCYFKYKLFLVFILCKCNQQSNFIFT